MSRSRRYDYAAIRALLDVEIDHRVIAQEIGCSMGLVGLIASGRLG